METNTCFDYFIIWGNGLQYSNDIINMIRNNPAFKILAIYKKDITEDMNTFIQKVYSSDIVPFQHLIAKTRYLIKTIPSFIFILVMNNNSRKAMVGEGEFRHIQGLTVMDMKIAIRNKYNPKNPNGTISTEHVIHGSDYESQVDHILSLLNLPLKEYYITSPNAYIKASSFLDIFDYEVININLDNCYFHILNEGMLKLTETPHYKFILGNKQLYISYWNKNFGINLVEDHSPESFEKLIKNFKDIQEDRLPVVKRNEDENFTERPIGSIIALDGAHRLAILKSRGITNVNCALIKPFKDVVNLIGLFKTLTSFKYLLLRKPNIFPSYVSYSDLDIFTDNPNEIAEVIIKFLNYYVIRHEYTVKKYDVGTAIHVDVYKKSSDKIDIKFDIHNKLDCYPSITDQNYVETLINNPVNINLKGAKIYIAPVMDELALRFLEYYHTKDIRPDKIKHIKFIQNLTNSINYKELINKIVSITDINKSEVIKILN